MGKLCPGVTRLFLIFMIFICATASAQDDFIFARDFAQNNGISFQWFPIQRMMVMRRGLQSVKITIDNTTAIVNGQNLSMNAAPIIKDNMVMASARALQFFFPGTKIPDSQQNETTSDSQPESSAPNLPTLANKPPVLPGQTPIATQPSQQQPSHANDEAVLVALRHSRRDDHTRVVLEFNNIVTYSGNLQGNIYKLTISGCRNLIPTRRTNPVGRDISKLDINSGPDRKGLILTFALPQPDKTPIIETVLDPFRMIVSFSAPDGSIMEEENAETTSTSGESQANDQQQQTQPTAQPSIEQAPDINIEVPEAKIINENFLGRTIVIDPGHGGTDRGFIFGTRPAEKEINLDVALKLKSKLEKLGLNAVLTRDNDINLSQNQRLSIANRHGADLFISIHTGGSRDKFKGGFACYVYSPEGTVNKSDISGLTQAAIYNEWLENTRFDLAKFLAQKVEQRLKNHITSDSRGVISMPVLPLKFVVNPAILVEVGMLSDETGGKNLISPNYRTALAHSIANAVVDFFNSIKINNDEGDA